MRAPWDREWLRVTPEQFERMVVGYLRGLGQPLTKFDVRCQEVVAGPDGEFRMDGVATFEALGADFLILVECKHHKNPIKRELIQVLVDKVHSVRAHKGMFFSTAPFQKGAIEYALSHKIALVHFTEGGPIYETRASFGPEGPRRPYDSCFLTLSERGGISYHFGTHETVTKFLFSGLVKPEKVSGGS